MSPGLVTFHGAVDDGPVALRALERNIGYRPRGEWMEADRVSGMLKTLKLSLQHLIPTPRLSTVRCLGDPHVFFKKASLQQGQRPFVSVVCGPPNRLYLIMHTMKHLQARGFPFLFWLRTPGPAELDEASKTSLRPCARCMLFWRTTVLPCVNRLAELTGCPDFLICEDNVALADGAHFSMVVACVEAPASVWGYGNFRRASLRRSPVWHGAKGLYVTPRFCAELEILLDNMPLHAYRHLDN